jgi:hypothetical protein
MSDSDIIDCMYDKKRGVDVELYYYSRWSPSRSSIWLRLPPNSTGKTIKEAIRIFISINCGLIDVVPVKLQTEDGADVDDGTPLSELLPKTLLFSPGLLLLSVL